MRQGTVLAPADPGGTLKPCSEADIREHKEKQKKQQQQRGQQLADQQLQPTLSSQQVTLVFISFRSRTFVRGLTILSVSTGRSGRRFCEQAGHGGNQAGEDRRPRKPGVQVPDCVDDLNPELCPILFCDKELMIRTMQVTPRKKSQESKANSTSGSRSRVSKHQSYRGMQAEEQDDSGDPDVEEDELDSEDAGDDEGAEDLLPSQELLSPQDKEKLGMKQQQKQQHHPQASQQRQKVLQHKEDHHSQHTGYTPEAKRVATQQPANGNSNKQKLTFSAADGAAAGAAAAALAPAAGAAAAQHNPRAMTLAQVFGRVPDETRKALLIERALEAGIGVEDLLSLGCGLSYEVLGPMLGSPLRKIDVAHMKVALGLSRPDAAPARAAPPDQQLPPAASYEAVCDWSDLNADILVLAEDDGQHLPSDDVQEGEAEYQQNYKQQQHPHPHMQQQEEEQKQQQQQLQQQRLTTKGKPRLVREMPPQGALSGCC